MVRYTTLKDTPAWATFAKRRWRDGRLLNLAGEMWLYRSIPMGPVEDARSPELSSNIGLPILDAHDELATMTPPIRLTRRGMAKASYREIQLLLVNVPRLFRPAPDAELAGYHLQQFPSTVIDRRVLLLGVRLVPKMRAEGFKGMVSEAIETFIEGGDPVENFERDFRDVEAAMSRSGLRVPTDEEMRIAESWWNQGGQANVPILVHTDHIHVFTTVDSVRAAAELSQDDTVKCESWPDMPNSHTISFATAREFDLPFVEGTDPRAWWASKLVQHGAVAVSIRGKVEPAKVTRDELRRMRQRYLGDVKERYASGKLDRAEQEETLGALHDVENFYASGGTPTLIEASTIVAFTGRDTRAGYDPTEIGNACGVALSSMVAVQDRAMAEMMLGSTVRANPYVRDLPSQTLAYSGLPNLSNVGDGDGALLGFTERDRQPAYMSAMAATDADTLPLFLAVGQTGAGKSVMMAWLADQFARTRNSRGERTPVVIFDPKERSDFSRVVSRSGGATLSLDDLATADGVFDPLRFSRETTVGIEMAHSTLMAVNPWGDVQSRARWETPLLKALNYGVQQGARSTLSALLAAQKDGVAERGLVDPVRAVADASPVFVSLCGRDDSGRSLSAAEGITYIRVGDKGLNLPSPGVDQADMSVPERVTMQLIRNIVYGSMTALTERQGVIMLDEAWVFTGAGRTEMDRVGRLARSWQVFPMLFTQRVTDALDAGLAGYISRGMILPITDMDEAVAACRLFKLEPTPARLSRITAGATMGDQGGDAGAPNWRSMRALRDPVTRQVLRGTIGIYADTSGRAVPTEVRIPPAFLADASTNRLDRELLERLEAASPRV